MTLLLNHVVQAQCPGCKNTLKIPANWIAEPMKCKHCGLVFQAKPPKKGRFIQRAIRAATSVNIQLPKLRKKKHKSPPPVATSKPFAPPPGVPVAAPAMPAGQVAVPVAKPAGGPGFASAPVAMPVGGAMHAGVPTAAPVAMGLANGHKPAGFKRRRRGGFQKLAFIFIFFLGLGSLVAVVHHMNPELFDLDGFASAGTEKEGDPATAPNTKPDAVKPTGATFVPPVTTGQATKPLFQPIPTRDTKPKRTYPTIATRNTNIAPPTDTRPMTNPTNPETTRPTLPTDTRPQGVADAGKGFPRRMLALSINNYPYANPVGYGGDQGSGPRSFHQLMFQLAEMMKVPFDQVTAVSDQGPAPLPGTKKLVELTIGQFLDTSRSMDRIVLVFIGHGVEVEGRAYLVPLLGEIDKPETLIPMDWLYAKLAASPAQEKLLILDVCRFERQRGEERGKVDPMTEGFEAVLQKPPRGVQVMTACGAGQRSWEMEYTNKQDPKEYVKGGVFLNMIGQTRDAGGLLDAKDAKPSDPLPVRDLFKALDRRTKARVTAYLKEEQTAKLFGSGPERMIAYDSKATIPNKPTPKLDWIKDDFPGGIATEADVKPFLEFLNPAKVPPIKVGDKSSPLTYSSLPPYPKNNLNAYKMGGKDSKDFQQVVEEGASTLRKFNNSFQETFPPLPDNQQQANQIKAQLEARGKGLATDVIAELQRQLTELDDLQGDRDNQSKLWQANYEYVRVRILFRMAYVLEYSAMLAKIRKDELPPLEKGVHVGYKLASKPNLDEGEARKYIDQAKKILDKMAKDHKGTPWELIAKREAITSLGLQWQPY
ncbi:MAG: caspase family protein [Gemmataceae bacterium]|nr:caspase family protein [Gemmataceae bacterium]